MPHRERLLVLLIRESMSDDRRNVEAHLREHGHLVPRVEDLATVNTSHGEHLEDHLRPIDGEVAIGQAQHRDATAMGHVRDYVAESRWLARHLERDIKAFLHAEL